jgi:hypothetical protein
MLTQQGGEYSTCPGTLFTISNSGIGLEFTELCVGRKLPVCHADLIREVNVKK